MHRLPMRIINQDPRLSLSAPLSHRDHLLGAVLMSRKVDVRIHDGNISYAYRSGKTVLVVANSTP